MSMHHMVTLQAGRATIVAVDQSLRLAWATMQLHASFVGRHSMVFNYCCELYVARIYRCHHDLV